MKICSLRFKNLNSLYGEWMIDFTDPAYQSNGIFALTGPTGAGKSTILDAICLALYGETPRLGKITKSQNEILSRQATECSAEVHFATPEGAFLCTWSQRRARNRLEGKLQDQEHQISDAVTGKVIENKKSKVLAVIEQKTGMDFDRFTRSILLAQGRFDHFLKAGDEQKSKLLEQITGTDIYSTISQQVFERFRTEENILKTLKTDQDHPHLLSEETYQACQTGQQRYQQQIMDLTTQLKQIETELTWHQNIAKLHQTLSDLQTDQTKLNSQLSDFIPTRQKLAMAIKAQEIEGPYQSLILLQQDHSNHQARLARIETDLPVLQQAHAEKADICLNADKRCQTARQAVIDTAPLLQQIRTLDQTLAHQLEKNKDQQQKMSDLTTKLTSAQSDKKKLDHEISACQQDLSQLADYHANHAADSWLVENLSGLQADFDRFQARQTDLHQKQSEQKKRIQAQQYEQAKIDRHQQNLTSLHQQQAQIIRHLSDTQQNLDDLLQGKLLREYQSEKDSLIGEKSLLDKIASLEEQRAQLVSGDPCPLCGATNHPYAVQDTPSPDQKQQEIDHITAHIQLIEKQQEILSGFNQQKQDLDRNIQEAQHQQNLRQKDVSTYQDQQHQCQTEINEITEELTHLAQNLHQNLTQLGISETALSDMADLKDTLIKRRQKWLDLAEGQKTLDLKKSQLTERQQNLSQQLASIEQSCRDEQKTLAVLQQKYQDLRQQRQTLFGDNDPDLRQQALQQDLETAEQSLKIHQQDLLETQKQLDHVKTEQHLLAERLAEQDQKLTHALNLFQENCQQHGFQDQSTFEQARLPAEERENLKKLADLLDNQAKDLQARMTERQHDLQTEQQRQLSDQAPADLVIKQQDLTDTRDACQKKATECEVKLQAHQHALSDQQAQLVKIQAQESELQRWQKLSHLIGSADGKKFRNFAQGLTFDIMIQQANRELAKMSDRYLLLRDTDKLLDLNVIDHYQAGDIRSTRNLSGGESFLVSLALALGLSGMVSRNIRVDSLFLDEGFGTLDEDTLDTALDLLASLYQEGKLIGIISHIPALKDRISTQIAVTPTTGGRSQLSGPGCQRVER